MATVDAPLTMTDISQRGDRAYAVFVTVEFGGDPDRIEIRVRGASGVSVLCVGTTALTSVLMLSPESPTHQLVRQGAALNEVVIPSDYDHLTVTVRVPHETDVREYVTAVTDSLGGVELVAESHESAGQSSAAVTAAVDDRLTGRQHEVLRMAFHAGYFDWSRSADADTVAAKVGITQSTLSQHLRTTERKLFEVLIY